MKHLSLTIISTLALSSSIIASTIGKNIQDSSLVVYNSGIGLVHEKRSLNVNKDDTFIQYEGIASTIETDSVNVVLPNSVKLYSQQYRFDKLSQAKLLNAHIGKKIEVKVLKDTTNFKTITATLLSNSGSQALVKTADAKIISVNTYDIIFTTIPKELITKPSLVWNIKAQKDIDATVELDYLIKNISWKSDYILNVSNNSANLSGWMSIDNRSGKKFEDTKLIVLAGDINIPKPIQNHYRKNIAYAAMADSEPVQEISHEGYHLYKVPFKINIANNEKSQIKFIEKENITIKRVYKTVLTNPLYLYAQSKHDVTQYIHLNALDAVLPRGVVRTYSKVADQTILLGQTNIKHTPKNTPIKLKIGTNFDLKVKETLISRQNSKHQLNSTVEYLVTNSSDEEKTIEILIPFNVDKKSKIKTALDFKYKEGNKVSFNLKVSANSSDKFRVDFFSQQ